MEKYSQFRDKGSGIAPFFPVPSQSSGIYLPFHILLFLIRIPLLVALVVCYFAIFSWLLPTPSVPRKVLLWTPFAILGIWLVDLRIDGVRRGSLNKSPTHLPHPGTIIAASSTSPLDALYLAAIFDPIFTTSYPHTRLVTPVSLPYAMISALLPSSMRFTPSETIQLTTLASLLAQNPNRTIVIFPETTPTNSRAILPLSPSLATAPANTKTFPTSLKYNPADVTTPVPGARASCRFVWNLCKVPTHTIRVRIAEPVIVDAEKSVGTPKSANSYATNFFDSMGNGQNEAVAVGGKRVGSAGEEGEELSLGEKRVLDQVGEALARLGRVKRVAIGVKEKVDFVDMWRGRGRAKKRR